jgi:D-xylose transport system substrate-binding protein
MKMTRRDVLGTAASVAATMTLLSFPRRASAAGPKIGFLLHTMQEERYQHDKADFIAKAQALGATVLFDAANDDEQVQLGSFDNMMTQGADVIVMQPVNSGTAGNMVKRANREGIRVIGYDSMLVNGPLDALVTPDQWAVGSLQAHAMVDWLKARNNGEVRGKVALIRGQPGDSNATAMSGGVLEVIKANPGLELVADQSEPGWSSDKAMATAEDVLTKHNNNVQAFICNNSGMARGVISALTAQNLADANKVFVAGSDADLANIQYVAQGKQAVEVWKQVKPLAEAAAELAVKMAKDRKAKIESLTKVDKMVNNGFTEVPTIVTPVTLITKDNIEQTLIAAGIFTKAQVYGA